jgi:hypothetical protein
VVNAVSSSMTPTNNGLLVGVLELLAVFTTGYWWGSWNSLPSSSRVIGVGRGTIYGVHHGLLAGSWNYLPSSPRAIGGGHGTTYSGK